VPALVMATPPFFALLWGQPKISADFFQTPWGLSCRIFNIPISSKWLRRMGTVRREPEASIYLFVKSASGEAMMGPTNALDPFNKQPGSTTVLEVHKYPNFQVVAWRNDLPEICGEHIRGVNQGQYGWIPLQEGRYVADVSVRDIAAGETFNFEREFFVGPNAVETKWIDD
jgi:hypothetical protein